MGVLSPYLRQLYLEKHGLEWAYPTASVAHPLDEEDAVILSESVATGLRKAFGIRLNNI
jgi:hypothetical protein